MDNFKVCGGEDGLLEPDYAANTGYESIEASCDDIDNDCNGEIDENYGSNGTITFTDTNGTTDPIKGTLAEPVPAKVERSYAVMTLSLRVQPQTKSAKKFATAWTMTAMAKWTKASMRPWQICNGVCAGQTKVCGAGDGWVEPDYTLIDKYEAEEISCDGIDNDCDEEVDELYVADGPLSYTDLDGTTAPQRRQLRCGHVFRWNRGLL